MILTRRSFLVSLAATLAAPAIVRASSLMPVRAPKLLTVDELLKLRINAAYAATRHAITKNLYGDIVSFTSSVRTFVAKPEWEYTALNRTIVLLGAR